MDFPNFRRVRLAGGKSQDTRHYVKRAKSDRVRVHWSPVHREQSAHWKERNARADVPLKARVRRGGTAGLGALAGQPGWGNGGVPISYQELVKRMGIEFMRVGAIR